MPAPLPVRFLDDDGRRVQTIVDDYAEPAPEQLVEAYRRMVIGRRFDIQATALTKQGRLAVYPSSRGQEACQVGAMLALQPGDWAFPTYRESVALVTRGIDPIEVLTLLRGDAHCGYDPVATRTRPSARRWPPSSSTPPASPTAEMRKGRGCVALAFVGDGATSEGDFHEALNFAAVFKAPVVFFVQNNKYAICVPLSKQTAAPSLSYKGIGYGIAVGAGRRQRPDGRAGGADQGGRRTRASGNGPVLVEAHTYRMDAHTNADDATRYRDEDEVTAGCGATRSPGWRPTCAPRACSTTRRSPRSRRRPRTSPPTCAPA